MLLIRLTAYSLVGMCNRHPALYVGVQDTIYVGVQDSKLYHVCLQATLIWRS